MEDLNKLIGKRVNVDLIRTEDWQSEKYIRNGIVNRVTEHGQVVVFCDEHSTHSINCHGGYYYPSAYNIQLLN